MVKYINIYIIHLINIIFMYDVRINYANIDKNMWILISLPVTVRFLDFTTVMFISVLISITIYIKFSLKSVINRGIFI